ncbi:MAG: ribosome biogenesis GTP-binding protein YihA/YsxC [Pseudomonadota bacterium]
MKIISASFVTSAVSPSQYPQSVYPEIAFAGRSNVGKSSLINRLTNHKRLAQTSNTPGRTRCINFFLLNNSFHLVDLPGYGYAKVSAHEQSKWQPMIENYLTGRLTLRVIVVVLDIRRTPSDKDHQLLSWLNFYNLRSIIVLTKSDKVSRSAQNKQRLAIAAALSHSLDDIMLFSASSGQGKELLWKRIANELK